MIGATPNSSSSDILPQESRETKIFNNNGVQYKILNAITITRGIYGYPIESYTITTPDNYILTLLRIPNYKSTKCMYDPKITLDTSKLV